MGTKADIAFHTEVGLRIIGTFDNFLALNSGAGISRFSTVKINPGMGAVTERFVKRFSTATQGIVWRSLYRIHFVPC